MVIRARVFFTSANPSRRHRTRTAVTQARHVHHALAVHMTLFTRYGTVHGHCLPECGTVHPAAGSLPHAVVMPDDTEAAVHRAWLEANVKEAEDDEAQAIAVHRRVQAARRLLEESKATALEQTATGAHQHMPSSSSSSSSPVAASQLVPTTSSTYEDTVVVGLHLPTVAVLNIRQLVNIVLDSSTNYASWRDLMEQALQCYALIKHVMNNASSNDPRWIQMDNVVLNWISNSILADLHQVVRKRGCTARHL
jgi:hypothetical protein